MKLTLLHFFPDKLNLYGDRGNIITLKRRCEWRGIDLEVKEIRSASEANMSEADILFIGGGSDREQALATADLFTIKNEFKSAIDDGISALMICGGYQFLGSYYQLQSGEKLKGLEILDFHTVSKPGRLIGNIIVESEDLGKIIGFENHGGRTYHAYDALGSVLKGHGNNDTDKKEGIRYNNLLGTYLHGPLLPKNPMVADEMISKALDRKYGINQLTVLNDELEGLTRKHVETLIMK